MPNVMYTRQFTFTWRKIKNFSRVKPAVKLISMFSEIGSRGLATPGGQGSLAKKKRRFLIITFSKISPNSYMAFCGITAVDIIPNPQHNTGRMRTATTTLEDSLSKLMEWTVALFRVVANAYTPTRVVLLTDLSSAMASVSHTRPHRPTTTTDNQWRQTTIKTLNLTLSFRLKVVWQVVRYVRNIADFWSCEFGPYGDVWLLIYLSRPATSKQPAEFRTEESESRLSRMSARKALTNAFFVCLLPSWCQRRTNRSFF